MAAAVTPALKLAAAPLARSSSPLAQVVSPACGCSPFPSNPRGEKKTALDSFFLFPVSLDRSLARRRHSSSPPQPPASRPPLATSSWNLIAPTGQEEPQSIAFGAASLTCNIGFPKLVLTTPRCSWLLVDAAAMSEGDVQRASWNFLCERGLVDVLHEHKHEKYRGQNGWKPEGWRSIVTKFNEKFPSARFTKGQIQEKEKELKGSFRMLRDYRKNSGGGWNDSLCMINATPDEWERLCKNNPNLKKFRKKSFPLYYSIEKLYEGSIATGELNFTSTEAPDLMPPTSAEPMNLDDLEVGANPFSANLERQGPSNGTINLEEDEHTTSSCSGQKVAGNGKKRKQSQVAAVLQDFVDFRVKQTKDFMDELNVNTKPNEDYSIKNCLAVLESIDELSEMEKAKAAKIFKCEQNREIFLNLKNPGVHLLWIQDEISPRPS